MDNQHLINKRTGSNGQLNSGSSRTAQGMKLQDNRPTFKLNPVQLKKKSKAVSTNAPIQLGKVNNVIKKKTLAERRKEKEIEARKDLLKPWRKYDRILASVKSQVLMAELEFKDIKNRLEDDEDLHELALIEFKLRKIKLAAPKIRREIINKPMGRFRNQDVEQKALVSQLEGFKYQIYNLVQTVKKMFPTHSGGFGAKGRAHQMEVEVNPQFPKLNSTQDNSFVNNFSINGTGLTHDIFKKPAKVVKEKAGPAIVMGKSNVSLNERKTNLTLLESKLASVKTPQPKSFVNAPVGKDREGGQYTNMQNTNAAGYAYIANIPNWNSQRWEWLHVRGAGLGGATNATNLVAGTRDANTHMIPFESNIRLLGAAAHNSTNYNQLDVIWSVNSQIAKAKHAFSGIQIEWLLRHKTTGSKNIKGIARFNPLHTGSNISKKEVEILENALTEVRDNVT